METSLRVFCGSYISEENAKEVSAKYWQITQALELVNFPFGKLRTVRTTRLLCQSSFTRDDFDFTDLLFSR